MGIQSQVHVTDLSLYGSLDGWFVAIMQCRLARVLVHLAHSRLPLAPTPLEPSHCILRCLRTPGMQSFILSLTLIIHTLLLTDMASEHQQLRDATAPLRRSSNALSFIEVENNKVARTPLSGLEPLSPPPTALSYDSAPSTIGSLSGFSAQTEQATPDAVVPVPHKRFYFEDGNVVFLVSKGNPARHGSAN
jgi:hypothetical protein